MARPVPSEEFQRQSQIQKSKRKSNGFTDDFEVDFTAGAKNTKQTKTHHSEEISGDKDDRRKSLADGNEKKVIQYGDRQRVNFLNRI